MRPSCLLIVLLAVCTHALKLNHGSKISEFVEDATDFLLDARWQIQQMDDLSKEVGELAEEVKAGEGTAR